MQLTVDQIKNVAVVMVNLDEFDASNAEDGSSWRSFCEVLGKESIHLAVLADVLKINLGVDNMLHGQTGGFHNRFKVIERLAELRIKSRW